MPSSTSSISSTPTQTSSSSSSSLDGRTVALGVVLGVVGCLAIVGIIIFALRLKRRTPRDETESMVMDRTHTKFLRQTAVAPNHPAHQVIPFGSPGGETPRFVHTPGVNMRVATRRPDGGWDFLDPRDPLTPLGLFNPDSVPPSPSSTIFSRNKEVGMKFGHTTNRELEELGDVVPPPAYDPEEGYISKA